MPDTQATRRENLRRLVATRRLERQLSVSSAARAAGVSRGTWIALEAGSRETETYNYAGVERALAWAPGSIDDILDGGDPIPLEEDRESKQDPNAETRLKAIRDNPDNEPNVRRQAQAALDLIYAILDGQTNGGRRAG